MKRTITAFILLSAVIIWSVSGIFIVKRENAVLIRTIDRIENSEQSEQYAIELEKLWKSYEKKMSLIVADEKLTELSMSVAKVRPYCIDANDELSAELENIKRQLELIYRSELPLWYNIL